MLLLLATALAADTPLTWSGIDYGLVQMVGTQDFHEPAAIFPGYLDKWNALFLDEYVDDLGRRLQRPIAPDIGHLRPLHDAASPDTQIRRVDGPSVHASVLSRADVVVRVASYPVSGEGMAVTYVADQLSKPDRMGCFWVTFYDRASLTVHATTYQCGSAAGLGFRNYWFGAVKAVTDALKPSAVPAASTQVVLTEAEVAAAGARSASTASALTARAAHTEQTKNWIPIRIAPAGLALLEEHGIGYEVIRD